MLANRYRPAVENLLIHCAEMVPGQSLLVLHEDPDQGYYDRAIVDAVVQGAEGLGLDVSSAQISFSPTVEDPSPELTARMKAADRTLFLARLGDQIRFRSSMSDIRPVMSYALDGEMLASGFGVADHRGMTRLMHLINDTLARAEDIHVTCPLGTDFRGTRAMFPATDADTTVKRFPLSVFTPVPTGNFSGKVVQQGFLIGTGSNFYHPYVCPIERPVTFHFDDNKIVDIQGRSEDVKAARAHYEFVGALFDIEPFLVHSWHAGIHPGCHYSQPVADNFERWGGGAFGNPRLLHFHTCGTYAPGEISWNVLDPTVRVDGVALWENGVLNPSRLVGGQEVLDTYPNVAAVFLNPARDVGLGAGEQLTA